MLLNNTKLILLLLFFIFPNVLFASDMSGLVVFFYGVLIILAIGIFSIIWFLTKNKEISAKVKILRVLPFSIFLGISPVPNSMSQANVPFPAILGVFAEKPKEILVALVITLAYTLFIWLIYILICISKERKHLQNMQAEEKFRKQKDKEKLEKIKRLDKGL
jgi:hypothetical protein